MNEYTLDDCTYYKKLMIRDTPVFFFDVHNMALPVWGSYAVKYGPLHLITFDTHTDTYKAFGSIMGEKDIKDIRKCLSSLRYQRDNYSFEDIFKFANTILNTEQIKTAVAFEYLVSYTVRCHREKKELSYNYEDADRRNGFDAVYIGDNDVRIPEIREPLVLDFDLDYFRTPSEIDGIREYITSYFRRASVVTIAREEEYFNRERKDDSFTIKDAEDKLIDVLYSI